MPFFNITVPSGRTRTLPERWKNFFCESSSDTIIGIANQERFNIKRGVRLRGEEKDRLHLLNETGSDVTLSGYYGLEDFNNLNLSGESIDIASMPDVTIDALPAVELAANAGFGVSDDVSVASAAKQDFAAPAGAKGAIVTLVTSGRAFGDVRVSGNAAYAANRGVPLPVDGGSYFIDSGADLTVHNSDGAAVDVNVTWIF